MSETKTEYPLPLLLHFLLDPCTLLDIMSPQQASFNFSTLQGAGTSDAMLATGRPDNFKLNTEATFILECKV